MQQASTSIDIKKVIPDDKLSIHEGGIAPLGKYKNQMIFWQIPLTFYFVFFLYFWFFISYVRRNGGISAFLPEAWSSIFMEPDTPLFILSCFSFQYL